MGDFSNCTTPSKFAARMGQCFSTTFQGLHGQSTQLGRGSGLRHIKISDISSAVADLFHSDGNGMIRRSKMTELLQLIPALRNRSSQDHSIVQIRYGGAKGTLVAWNDDAFDDVLTNSTSSSVVNPANFNVALRDSMIKFDAKFSQLEVCR